VLVNVCGSHPTDEDSGFESREDYVAAVTHEVEMACKDISLRLLNDPPDGGAALRLEVIEVLDREACPDDVTQATPELRTLFADGRKELKQRRSDKGIKVNVVNVVREKPKAGQAEGRAIDAVGETGAAEEIPKAGGGTETVRHGRNVVINDETLTSGPEIMVPGSTETEPCGRNGEILLHEIGHNSGMVLEHGKGDANETGFMTTPPSRSINAAQWQMLRRLWERFGEGSANEEQHSYVPRTDDTHHALVTQPPWAAQPAVDSLALALGPSGSLRGRVELAGLLPSTGFFDYTLRLAVDTDNDVTTCGEFYEFGEGYELVLETVVSSFPIVYAPATGGGPPPAAAADSTATASGGPFVSGSLTYLAGLYHVTVPLAAVHLSEVGSVGTGDEYAPHASVITFAHDVGVFPIAAGAIPAKGLLVKDGFPAGFVTTPLQPVRDPVLTSLPTTVAAFGPVVVTGQGFAPDSDVAVYLSHVRSFSNQPVATGGTDGAGGFGLLVDVGGPRSGDFLVAALDGEGNLATGVVTADVPCALQCSAEVPDHARVGAPVAFSVAVTPSACTEAVTVAWSFGDGSPGSTETALGHAYAQSGVYPWSLTASSGSASCSSGGTITVIDPATAVRRKLRRH